MALTLIKEDGTGNPAANCYADVADGDTYHEGRLYAAAWTAATTPDKQKSLVMATRLIDAEYQFHGAQAGTGQGLQWPRENCPDPDGQRTTTDGFLAADTVPCAVVQATCELARELLIADRTAAPAGEGLIAIWTETSGTKYCKDDTCPIISRLVQSLLAKYGTPTKRGPATAKLTRT